MGGEVNFQLHQLSSAQLIGGQEISISSSTPKKDLDEITISNQSMEDARTKGNMVPWLPPPLADHMIPDKAFSFEFLKSLFLKVQKKVVESLFDKWDSNIQLMNKRQKKRQLMEIEGELNRFSVFGGESLINLGADKNRAAGVAVIAFLMVVSPSLNPFPKVSNTTPLPGFSMIDSISSAAVALKAVPMEAASTLSVIGNLFAAVTFYPALLGTLQSVRGKGSEIKDLVFAKKYLEQVEKSVKNPAFDYLILQSALKPGVDKPNLDQTMQKKLMGVGKLALLLTSLALYYKVETGWLTGQEVGGLISGEIKLDKDDPRRPIITSISQLLRLFPEGQRVAILEAFFEYFDSKPSVEDLLSTNELLRNSDTNHTYERFLETGA